MLRQIKKRALKSFTDSLYLMNFIMVQSYTLLCLLYVLLSAWIPMNGSVLSTVLKTILVCAWTELGTHTGIIVYKATKENINKHSVQELSSMIDSIPNETVDDMAYTYIDPVEVDENGVLG